MPCDGVGQEVSSRWTKLNREGGHGHLELERLKKRTTQNIVSSWSLVAHSCSKSVIKRLFGFMFVFWKKEQKKIKRLLSRHFSCLIHFPFPQSQVVSSASNADCIPTKPLTPETWKHGHHTWAQSTEHENKERRREAEGTKWEHKYECRMHCNKTRNPTDYVASSLTARVWRKS